MIALLWALLVSCGPAPVTVLPPETGVAPAALRAALVVAFDNPGDKPTIEEGGRALADALRATGSFPLVELRTGADASPSALFLWLQALARRPDPHPDDTVLVAVLGHGRWTTGPDGSPRMGVSLSTGGTGGGGGQLLPLDELMASVDLVPGLHKAVLLDACTPDLGSGDRREGPLAETGSGAQIGTHTLLLSGEGRRQVGLARPGEGGLYARCLSEAIKGGGNHAGATTLLDAHLRAADCLGPSGQRPFVWPLDGAPTDIRLRPGATGSFILTGGLTGGLSGGETHIELDGTRIDPSPGALRLSAGEHRIGLRVGEQLLIQSLSTGGAPLHNMLLSGDPALPIEQRFRQVASPPEGLPGLVEIGGPAGLAPSAGHVNGATAATLGGRRGVLLSYSDTAPRWLVNTAAPGAGPTFADASAAVGIDPLEPPVHEAAPPGLLDLDQDGAPELCWTPRDGSLRCIDGASRLRRIDLGSALLRPPLQGDLDGDGDLDLVGQTRQGTRTWRYEAGQYRLDRVLGRVEDQSQGFFLLLDLDTVPGKDVLTHSSSLGIRAFLSPGPAGLGRLLQGAELGLPAGVDFIGLDDSDGELELRLHGHGWPRSEGFLLPRRSVVFRPGLSGPAEPSEHPPTGLIPGDVDLDGRTDLVAFYRSTAPAPAPAHLTYLRRPELGGWLPWPLPPGADEPADDVAVLLDDIDSDGDLDLLTVNGGELGHIFPGGAIRLLLNDASTSRSWLAVDLIADGRPILGARISVGAPHPAVALVDGSRTDGAALFGLGLDGPPAEVTVWWPDGTVSRVGRDRFIPEGRGWRARVAREAHRLPRVLVDSSVVDLNGRYGEERRPAPGLRGEDTTVWMLNLPGGGAAVFRDEMDGGGFIHWIGAAGEETHPPTAATGCAWATLQERPTPTLLLGCGEEVGGRYREVVRRLSVSSRLLETVPDVAIGFPRGWASGPSLWLASGNPHVREIDPVTLLPTGRALREPPGTRSRDHLRFTDDGRLLVLDTVASRVEVWDPRRSTDEPEALLPLRPAVGLPAWAPGLGWLVPVSGGLDLIDPARRVVRAFPFDDPVVAVVSLGGDRAAMLFAAPERHLLLFDLRRGEVERSLSLPPARGAAIAALY